MNIHFNTKKITGMFHRKLRDQFAVDPCADWEKIVLVSLAAIIITVGVHVFMFMKISQGEFFKSEKENGNGAQTIDRTKLKEVLEYYKTKEENLKRLQASLSEVPIQVSTSTATTSPR